MHSLPCMLHASHVSRGPSIHRRVLPCGASPGWQQRVCHRYVSRHSNDGSKPAHVQPDDSGNPPDESSGTQAVAAAAAQASQPLAAAAGAGATAAAVDASAALLAADGPTAADVADAGPPTAAGSHAEQHDGHKHSSTHKHHDPSAHPQPLFGQDIRRVWRLAIPLMINNIAGYALSIVGAIYIGRLGSLPLSASVLANSLYNCTGLSLALGLSAGMETLCGQAYGAGAYLRVGVILQRALLVCFTVCLPVVLLWSQSHTLLLQLGQQPEIAALASRYLILCIPCLFLTVTMECIRKYLQSQRAVKPAMAVAASVLVASPLFFWAFVEQWSMGLDGAAFAFIACQVATLLGLLAYVVFRAWRLRGKREQTWGGWSGEALKGWGEYASYGLPAAAMIAGEWWAYEVVILLAGLLPNASVALSTMGICLNINAWMYMLPLGLGQAVNTSISNALGAGHAASAKRAFLGGIASGSLMQAALALTITLQGNALVKLFTNDPQVISTCSTVLPLLAVLVFFDGVNSVVSGVLRGSGRQMLGAVCNFWGYFIVGLPLSAYLAFKAGMGIHGLWLGIIAGACVQAAVLVTMLLRWDWQKEVARVQALLKDVPGGKIAPQYGH